MALVPLSTQAVFSGGYPVEGARLFAFDAGTTTPRTLFLTQNLDPTRIHPVPVIAADGVLPVMFVGVGPYDVRLNDPGGAQIRFFGGLPGDAASSTDPAVLDPLRQVPTLAVVRFYGTGRRNGYVRANGGTIGPSSADASERANDDCHDLFVALYQADPALEVAGGRSPLGAEADWSAGKTIALPNYQGRFQIGTNTDIALGAVGGEAQHTLSLSEIPAHEHDATITISPAGAHTPSGSISDAPDHPHGINYLRSPAYNNGSLPATNTIGMDTTNTAQTGLGGAHGHVFTGTAVPDHDHDASVETAPAGSSLPHNNLPPYIGDTVYLKL